MNAKMESVYAPNIKMESEILPVRMGDFLGSEFGELTICGSEGAAESTVYYAHLQSCVEQRSGLMSYLGSPPATAPNLRRLRIAFSGKILLSQNQKFPDFLSKNARH